MSEISIYDIVPTPKLADKLIGTSVGGTIPDVTYNFTLEELLQLFIPNIPANNLQGVLDYGNTATQDINLTGTISTTNLTVLATANIYDSNLSGKTRVMAGLYDRTNSSGTAGQVLRSTGTQVEWYTIPTVIPTLQQVLQSGNTSDISIVLTANITAVTATASNVIANTSLAVNGTLKDGTASAGSSNQILSSTGSGVQWVDMPVYNVVSPLLYDTPTKTFSIQVANSTQGGYLSAADWINFDGKQDPILLTTTGTSGAATFVGNTLNIPVYSPDLSGYVPTSRTLTINGITYDLSANRTWTIPAGVASVTATSPLFSSGGANPDISIQVANTSQSGYLTNTDWNTFNAKQGALTLTTTGTNGPSTLVGDTLNIPQYQSVLTNPITGLGTTNYVSKFTSASSIGDSNIQDSGTLITLGSNSYVNGNLGIGTSSLTGRNLLVSANLTGATLSVGVTSNGAIQSDVTNARAFSTGVSVAASTTLLNLYHYTATQGTIGAGATIDSQMGFYAINTLVGATNNYGFYGAIPAQTGAWNLYMVGTANNYLAGSLGIGTTVLTGYNLRVSKPFSGATTSYGIVSDGSIQSDVTSTVQVFRATPSLTATTTLTNLYYYVAIQNTFASGSSVNSQAGFLVTNNLTGATNNYAFQSNLNAATNTWNLYMAGNASNYLAGSLGIGATSLTGYNLRVSKNITGATTSYGVSVDGAIQSDVTASSRSYYSNPSTSAAAFTLTNLYHFIADQSTIGSGSSVTNQYGFLVGASVIGATNNYAYYGNIASGTGRWNIYMNGTADNYMAGSLGIGNSSLTGYNLRVQKNITGGTSAYGVLSAGTVQSDVTGTAQYYTTTASTVATAFTLTTLVHYRANQSTIGAGSTVTNQYGFWADTTITGATNNYGFAGSIAAAAGSWNLYMVGTAKNYLAGDLGIGVSTNNASAKVQIDSTTQGFLPPRMTETQRTAITSPATGLIVYQTDGVEGLWVKTSTTWRELTVV